MKPDADKPFPARLMRAFGYAAAGVKHASRDRMFRCQIVIAVAVIVVAGWLRLPLVEWAILLLTMAFVLAMEVMNTAVEYVVDLASPDRHDLAGKAKDAAAGAVLIASLGAVVVGLALLGPRLWDRLLMMG